MNDGAVENVEHMWVDIWCLLDWIIGLCHKTTEMHLPWHELPNWRVHKMRRG